MRLRPMFTSAGVAALAVLTLSVQAQTIKPGLWESTSKVSGSPEMEQALANMQQQMASMPPEQRKMMEEMMSKQGVTLGANSSGMVVKMCVTKEMAERGDIPTQQQGDCTTTTSDKTSRGMTVKFSCTNPPSSGEGQFTFSGDSAYTMKLKVNSAAQGAPKTITVNSSAKWLSGDCGSIKPLALPKK
jgi:hypothetical protein